VAATRLDRLRDPLRRDWLERVKRSRAVGLTEEGITPEVLAGQLAACAQMRAE
jgi:hypothetical protein